jgi:sec-independent protein translocase protein TatB
MLKKMGSWLGSIKRYVSDVQNQVSEITDETIDQENKIKKPIDKKNNLKDKNG